MTTIDRPAEAPSAPIARADDARRIPGELGTWLFIGGELLVFAVLFVAYLEVRAEQPRAFADAQGSLSLALGTVNTVVLLTSSWLAAAVPRALAAGDRAVVIFLVQRGDASGVRPSDVHDPVFAATARKVAALGVEFRAFALVPEFVPAGDPRPGAASAELRLLGEIPVDLSPYPTAPVAAFRTELRAEAPAWVRGAARAR